jgi:uncharacterized protein YcgL (UPF0745 family)
MKKIVLIVVVSLFFANTMQAQSPQLDVIFEQYSEKKSFTYVYVKGAVRIHEYIPHDLIYDQIQINSIKFVKILTYEGNRNDTIAKRVVSKVKNTLKSENFELYLKVKDDDDRVEAYKKIYTSGKDIVLMVSDDTDLTIIWIYGK